MNKSLEKIKDYVGEKSFERIMEVIKIMGCESLENATYRIEMFGNNKSTPHIDNHKDILDKSINYQAIIEFPEKNMEIIIYLYSSFNKGKFEKDKIYISFLSNYFRYSWGKYSSGAEEIYIGKMDQYDAWCDDYHVSANFFPNDDGIVTSRLTIIINEDTMITTESKTGSVKYEASRGKNNHQDLGETDISRYYEHIKKILYNSEFSEKLKQEISEDNISKFIKLLEKPITDLQKSLTTENIKLRYQREIQREKQKRKAAIEKAQYELDIAPIIYKNSVSKAKNEYDEAVKRLTREIPTSGGNNND